MECGLDLDNFDPDQCQAAVVAYRVKVADTVREIAVHSHNKGQLILALHGGVTSEVAQAMWMVPPHYAVWIPSNMPHSNRATANARLCFLFIEPGSVTMPQQCCTLKISPLVRELILHLANVEQTSSPDPATERLAQVLLDELPKQPVEQLQLPMPSHPRIRAIAESLALHPHDNQPLSVWADKAAMSERNLSRLIVKETGLNFRRWRQQLQLILALQMLVAGKSVQKVAETLGYDSTTAFITMFKKALGTTPGRYLKTLQQDMIH